MVLPPPPPPPLPSVERAAGTRDLCEWKKSELIRISPWKTGTGAAAGFVSSVSRLKREVAFGCGLTSYVFNVLG